MELKDLKECKINHSDISSVEDSYNNLTKLIDLNNEKLDDKINKEINSIHSDLESINKNISENDNLFDEIFEEMMPSIVYYFSRKINRLKIIIGFLSILSIATFILLLTRFS